MGTTTTPKSAKETLNFWRENLSCEEQVKRQLAESYCNAENKSEYDFLNEISKLIENENQPTIQTSGQ